MTLPPLYPIVNVPSPDAPDIERAFDLARELCDAGVKLLQLRAKTLQAGAMTVLAHRMVHSLRGAGAKVIINDRIDVAVAAGAAGVHLGDEDLPVDPARRILGALRIADFLIGYSTHSVDEAATASRMPVEYLGFGPVFESPTKAGVREARGVEQLSRACKASRLPVVAIGGVTFENAAACWRAGAASVAVISEIEHASDRRRLVADYLRAARQVSTQN
jgi:thiamine-phosphate pyrophosphorylase